MSTKAHAIAALAFAAVLALAMAGYTAYRGRIGYSWEQEVPGVQLSRLDGSPYPFAHGTSKLLVLIRTGSPFCSQKAEELTRLGDTLRGYEILLI